MTGREPMFCTYCAKMFDEDLTAVEKKCLNCGCITYLNSTSVGVVIQPVGREGVVLILRDEGLGKGEWALPGGHVMAGETVRDAAAREVEEEATIVIPEPQRLLKAFRVHDSSHRKFVLNFFIAPAIENESLLPTFVRNREVKDRKVTSWPVPLAFSSHTDTLRDYYAELSQVRYETPAHGIHRS